MALRKAAKKKATKRRSKAPATPFKEADGPLALIPVSALVQLALRGVQPAPEQEKSVRDKAVDLFNDLHGSAPNPDAMPDVVALCYHALACLMVGIDIHAAGQQGADSHDKLHSLYLALGNTITVGNKMRENALQHAKTCMRCAQLTRAANLAPPEQSKAN